jgi:hypothetical protein
MLTSAGCSLVAEICLIELYVQQDEEREQSCKSSGKRSAVERLGSPQTTVWGGLEMTKAHERTQRRHVREKATIDHLVRDVYEPKVLDEERTDRSPTTSTGLPVEDQVRKEWDPREGGLPTFCRSQ